jgi:hypothetical protein
MYGITIIIGKVGGYLQKDGGDNAEQENIPTKSSISSGEKSSHTNAGKRKW